MSIPSATPNAFPPLSEWATHLQPESAWEPPLGECFRGLIYRGVALFADVAMLGLVWGFLVRPVLAPLSGAASGAVLLIAPWLYFTFLWGRFGTTVAMRLMGMRIVRSADGGSIDYGTAFVRLLVVAGELAVMVFGLPGLLVALPVLRDRRRQAIHDRIVGTVVVGRTRSA